MARIHEIRQKEVINTKDGCRLGFVSDVEIDIKSGKITKIIVPGPGKVLGVFGREQEYHIKWGDIKRIGDDIVLIETEPDDLLVDSE